jgi:hypothetical protein
MFLQRAQSGGLPNVVFNGPTALCLRNQFVDSFLKPGMRRLICTILLVNEPSSFIAEDEPKFRVAFCNRISRHPNPDFIDGHFQTYKPKFALADTGVFALLSSEIISLKPFGVALFGELFPVFVLIDHSASSPPGLI